MSYVRTWYEEDEEYKDQKLIDKLVGDIGWVDGFNSEGQILYHYSKDNRTDKSKIVPKNLQIEGLELAKWNASNLQENVENKFNQYHEKILIISKLTMGIGFSFIVLIVAGIFKFPFKIYKVLYYKIGQK